MLTMLWNVLKTATQTKPVDIAIPAFAAV
jgi:hypothetical protein